MIVGKGDFIIYIKEELRKLDCNIAEVEIGENINGQNNGILIEYTGDGSSELSDIGDIPVIYPFDFVDGAGAIVVFPGDDRIKWRAESGEKLERRAESGERRVSRVEMEGNQSGWLI